MKIAIKCIIRIKKYYENLVLLIVAVFYDEIKIYITQYWPVITVDSTAEL